MKKNEYKQGGFLKAIPYAILAAVLAAITVILINM